jgi:superfamily I DNA and RNA helicase
LRAYPDEWIGVIAPRNAILDEFQQFVSGTRLEPLLTVHRDGDRSFDTDRPIVAMTAHSAKGTEFRAVHILGAEAFAPWYTREIGFTVVTRAKTAVDCYYTGSVDGSLIAALTEERVPDPLEVFK